MKMRNTFQKKLVILEQNIFISNYCNFLIYFNLNKSNVRLFLHNKYILLDVFNLQAIFKYKTTSLFFKKITYKIYKNKFYKLSNSNLNYTKFHFIDNVCILVQFSIINFIKLLYYIYSLQIFEVYRIVAYLQIIIYKFFYRHSNQGIHHYGGSVKFRFYNN